MSLRPKRSSTNKPSMDDDFKDPLKNYDKPVYHDDFERSLSEESVMVLQSTPFKTVSVDTTIEDAMKSMVELDIACLLVTKGESLVGIFSERDILDKVASRYAQVRTRPVSEFMTREPVVAHETDSPAKALNLMSIGGFRHIPILDIDERLVGVIGPRRVINYLHGYFQAAPGASSVVRVSRSKVPSNKGAQKMAKSSKPAVKKAAAKPAAKAAAKPAKKVAAKPAAKVAAKPAAKPAAKKAVAKKPAAKK